jgi:hypothetical protein
LESEIPEQYLLAVKARLLTTVFVVLKEGRRRFGDYKTKREHGIQAKLVAFDSESTFRQSVKGSSVVRHSPTFLLLAIFGSGLLTFTKKKPKVFLFRKKEEVKIM